MSDPRAAAARRRRTVIIAAIAAGVAIVIGAAAAAAAYVSSNRAERETIVGAAPSSAPSSPIAAASVGPTPSSAPPPPSPPPPAAPNVPGADAAGFVGSPARCAQGDKTRMIVLTAATSQAVVCERGSSLYYTGWHASDGSAVRIEGVKPAGAGWVVWGMDLTVNVTPAAVSFTTPWSDFSEQATASYVN